MVSQNALLLPWVAFDEFLYNSNEKRNKTEHPFKHLQEKGLDSLFGIEEDTTEFLCFLS